MPEMNGSEAASALRSANYPYLIIGLTGNVLDDDVEDYLKSGADAVFAKPLKNDLFDLLLEYASIHGLHSRCSEGLKLKIDMINRKIDWVPLKSDGQLLDGSIDFRKK